MTAQKITRRQSLARDMETDLDVMCYTCYVMDYDMSMSIGLPDTYSFESER